MSAPASRGSTAGGPLSVASSRIGSQTARQRAWRRVRRIRNARISNTTHAISSVAPPTAASSTVTVRPVIIGVKTGRRSGGAAPACIERALLVDADRVEQPDPASEPVTAPHRDGPHVAGAEPADVVFELLARRDREPDDVVFATAVVAINGAGVTERALAGQERPEGRVSQAERTHGLLEAAGEHRHVAGVIAASGHAAIEDPSASETRVNSSQQTNLRNDLVREAALRLDRDDRALADGMKIGGGEQIIAQRKAPHIMERRRPAAVFAGVAGDLE